MNRCLRRLSGSRSVFRSLTTTDSNTSVCNNNIVINSTTDLPRNAFSVFSYNSFKSHASSTEGWGNESIRWRSDEAKGRYYRDIGFPESEDKQLKIIQKGDIVNLSELLFTKNRDYLIRYNHPQLVTADMLAGKVVVICFVREDPYSSSSRSDIFIPSLIDVYNDLMHKNCFEVVFVFVDDAFVSMKTKKSYTGYCLCESPSESEIFEDIFSRMPWTAIPFSDITLRKNLEKKFGLETSWYPTGIVIDSTGKVLQTHCGDIFDIYGSPAYPFSDERVAFLDSEDEVISKQPSLKSLLASPQRDYVISNKGEQVLI